MEDQEPLKFPVQKTEAPVVCADPVEHIGQQYITEVAAAIKMLEIEKAQIDMAVRKHHYSMLIERMEIDKLDVRIELLKTQNKM